MVLKIFMESISTVKEATNLKKKTKNVFLLKYHVILFSALLEQ